MVIAYLDETGDHSLRNSDSNFPVFVLMLYIVDIEHYINNVVPHANRIKFEYFGHEGVIFHSRDIRKAQREFHILKDSKIRINFVHDMNSLMRDNSYELIAVGIDKKKHFDRYRYKAEDPYELSLKFSLERFIAMLKDMDQRNVTIVAESRGKKEDKNLKAAFNEITNLGTYYLPQNQFRKINWNLAFVKKQMNIIGTQIADLAAYPTARYIINPSEKNPAYKIIEKKFYAGPNNNINGLKIFP